MHKFSDTPREYKENNEIIRISVANLVFDINWKIVGIVNKKRLNLWMKKISFIWWSAILFNKALIEELGGFDFDENNTKFKIEIDKLDQIIHMFSQENSFLYERAIYRELKEELSKEMIWNMAEPILSEEECYEFAPEFIGTVYSEWYWSSVKREILTKYIWHMFSLKWPAHIVEKMEKHEIVYFLDEQDFERKETGDWFILWSNVITVKEFFRQ